MAELADGLGLTGIAAENRAYVARGVAAMERLWSDRHGQYLCRDRVTGALVDSPPIGGLLAAFRAVPEARAVRIAQTIDGHGTRFRVTSHPPPDPRHDPKRYWRGPVWLVVTHMIADGLARAGQDAAAARITASSLDLIRISGFAEYNDPQTGAPCGGARFTWTAAMVLKFLALEAAT